MVIGLSIVMIAMRPDFRTQQGFSHLGHSRKIGLPFPVMGRPPRLFWLNELVDDSVMMVPAMVGHMEPRAEELAALLNELADRPAVLALNLPQTASFEDRFASLLGRWVRYRAPKFDRQAWIEPLNAITADFRALARDIENSPKPAPRLIWAFSLEAKSILNLQSSKRPFIDAFPTIEALDREFPELSLRLSLHAFMRCKEIGDPRSSELRDRTIQRYQNLSGWNSYRHLVE